MKKVDNFENMLKIIIIKIILFMKNYFNLIIFKLNSLI